MYNGRLRTQTQRWHDFTRVLIASRFIEATVQLELYNVPRPPYGVEAYIYSLFVNKLARKEGRATALLDMAERLAAENGCQSVWLEWSGKDTPIEILEWYIRRGYNLIANNDNGAKLLEKKLTPKTSAQT